MPRPKKQPSRPRDSRIDRGEPPPEAAWQEARAWLAGIGVELPETPPAASDPEREQMNHLWMSSESGRLTVDPFGDEPLACVLAPVLLGTASAAEKDFVGNLFSEVLGTGTPEQIAGFFARVSKLAANAEQPHRNAAAFAGYAAFFGEVGREPSKPALKAYLLARPDHFHGLPPGDDKKAWSRLWSDCGLSRLADR